MSYNVARLYRGLLPKNPPSQDVVIYYAVACDNQVLREDKLMVPLREVL